MSRLAFDRACFTLTDEHILLLSNMSVERDEDYNTPTFDAKRPYGNSDIPGDIKRLLGWDSTRLTEEMYDMHEETALALQVVLSARSFIPGDYIFDWYAERWHRVI